MTSLIQSIFDPSFDNFEQKAIDLCHFQLENNPVYRQFVELANKQSSNINSLEDIPFLPIEFFKSQTVKSGSFEPELTFLSSGTTGSNPSRHPIRDLNLYEKSFTRGFRYFYGEPKNWAILALLPTYLDNPNASLVYMVDSLIRQSQYPQSGFFKEDFSVLREQLLTLKKQKVPTLLMGVSYALLNLADQYPMDLSGITVMETGGMKGQREEWVREALHHRLKSQFNQKNIHSEYGMTELLSQAYSYGDGYFQAPPWMKVLVRDPYDPFDVQETGKGALTIIDLANIHSCAFIATQDLGEKWEDGTFQVLGRFDHADVRGCNLMMVD